MGADRSSDRRRLPRAGLRAKLLLLASSFVFLLLIALVGEGLCRLVSDQPLMGSSRHLFATAVWGETKGNAPNVEAVSFGGKVYTDRYGFRVPPPDRRVERPTTDALLILGDSVAFGAGVDEDRTLAGRLREALPSTAVHNSSVVGYWTADYESVVEHFVPAHTDVTRVVLVLCLNDVRTLSAKEIDRALVASGKQRLSWFTRMRQFGPAKAINEFLRTKSKLYLLAKNTVSRPRVRMWESTLAGYSDPRFDLEAALRPLIAVDGFLRERGIPFTVVVSPYARQVDVAGPEIAAPQAMIGGHLASHGVDVVDALPAFRASGRSTDELFLVHDPMHLAEAGHQLIARMILERIESF